MFILLVMAKFKRLSLENRRVPVQTLELYNCVLLIYICFAVNEHRLLFADDSTGSEPRPLQQRSLTVRSLRMLS
jgi:hypothetical protein